jgi:NADH-quinone oxidoreductase subunit L
MGIEQAWLIPAYGFVAFGVLAVFGRYLPGQGKYLSVLAVVAGFVTFWPVLLDFVRRGVGFYQFERQWFDVSAVGVGPEKLLSVGSGIIVDPLTIVMLGLVTFVSVAVQVYSLGYMRHEHNGHVVDDSRIGWYFAAHSLFTASMLTIVLADNLLLLYLAWELVGLCSYLLIGFWWERRSAAEAAKKAFITTRIGDVGLLIGILLLFKETGTFDITDILAQVTAGGLNDGVVTSSAFLIFLGAMGKSAQFPLHVWLPDAMEGPTPVSALIHAATMVTAGVFLVARLLPLYDAVYAAQLTVAIVGLVTALMGASMALTSTDLKRILAYSTMSHLGFMMLALGAGGMTAAMFHLLTHGVAKAMLFLSAGSIMHSMHEETDIRRMGGLRHRMPRTTLAFTIGALALAGIAPLSAFWSKDEILLAVKDGLNPVFLVLFLVAVVMSALYMARAINLVFFGPLSDDNRDVRESPAVMSVPLLVLGALTLVIGFIVLPLGGSYDGIASFLDSHHEFEFSPLWTGVSIALAGGGLLSGLWLYSSRRDIVDGARERFSFVHRLTVERYYMDHAYQWAIDQVVMRAGAFVALFDRHVINDGGVNGSGQTVLEVGKRVRLHVTGLFADYGLGMVAGVSVIALFFWLRT